MQAPSDSDDPYVKSLFEKRAEVAGRVFGVLEAAEARAAKGGRDVTAVEHSLLTEAEAQLDRYDEEIKRVREVRARLAPGDAVINQIYEANRMSANEEGTTLRTLFHEARAGRTGEFDSAVSMQFMEARALTTSTPLIPTTFADFVTVYERTTTPMLDPNLVTILGRSTGAPITLPRLTSDPATAGTVTAQEAAISELDPTVSSVTLTPFKYAVINLWSSELDTDEIYGLQDLMARTAGRALGQDIGTHLTLGTGTTQPWGFVTRAALAGTAAGTANGSPSWTFAGYPDIVDLYFSVASEYRAVGSWQVSNTAFAHLLKMRDDNNQPVILPGFGGNVPNTLLGRPIYENPAMATLASASKSIAFGDFSRYIVDRVTPVNVRLSYEYKFNTDQVALRTTERVDGDLVDTAAVKVLVSANT